MLARCTRGCTQLSARSAAVPRSGGGAPRLSARAPAAGRAQRRSLRALRASAPDADGAHGTSDGAHGSAGVAKKPILDGLGLSLGPVAMTFEGSKKEDKAVASRLASATGVTLGPIALSLGESAVRERGGADEGSDVAAAEAVRLNALSSEEWRQAHLREDGTVDLWLEDDFNAPSRMPAGRPYGARENVAWSGREAADADVAVNTVSITGRDGEGVFTVRSAADRYVLFEAEEQGFVLPSACRMGCCTACAVKVKSGALSQPQALGLSAGLRREGYALLCVAFADQGDVQCELQDPDEVYEMQFGEAFAALATDKNAPSILRDDLALEIAAGDE